MKNCIQQLIDQGTIQIGRLIKEDKGVVVVGILYPTPEVHIPVTPLVIQIPSYFPYESTRAVTWRYEPNVYKQGQENQPLVINEPNVTTIPGPGGMTRRGPVFAQRSVEPLA